MRVKDKVMYQSFKKRMHLEAPSCKTQILKKSNTISLILGFHVPGSS